jgi:hypothetical protein
MAITGKEYNYEMRLNITSVTIAGRNIPVMRGGKFTGEQFYGIGFRFMTDEEGSRNMQGAGVKTDDIVINGTVDVVHAPDELLGSWNMNVEAHEVD